MRLREGLLTQGQGDVIIGGQRFVVREDRVSQAIRAANPDAPGLAFHATARADLVGPGGPVPVQTRTVIRDGVAIQVPKGAEEQFTFLGPGGTRPDWMTSSAYGRSGETPGIMGYNLGPEDLAVPGATPGVTKAFKRGFELEYGVATGADLPATYPTARVGEPLKGTLYLPEDVAAPTFPQRTQANVGAVTDTLTGRQRGQIRVDGVADLSDDALARGIYGDEAVNAGLTPRQQRYVQLSRLDDTALAQRAADDPVAADVLSARRQGDELADTAGRVNRERVIGADGTAYVYNRAGRPGPGAGGRAPG